MNFSSTTRLLVLIYSLALTTTFYAGIERDLEVDALFTTINHTQSHHGAYALRSLLAQPVADQNILENRQTIIAHIAENKELHTQLNKLLKAFAEQESKFEYIMHPASDIETAFLENLYFSHDYLKKYNHSPLYLELGQIAYLGNLCSSLVQHALAFAILTWGVGEEHVCAFHPKKHDHKHKKHDHNHSVDHHKDKSHKHQESNHTSCTESHHTHDHHHHDCDCDHDHQSQNPFKILVQSPSFRNAFQLWHGVAQIQELYGIQAVVRNHLKNITEIQRQLMGVARNIRTLQEIHALLEKHPEVSNHITHYQDLKNISLSTGDISDKLATCLKLLQGKTFMDKPSAFSRIGIILATYKLLQEVAHELEPALNAVGEIDAYVSCAELVTKHQSGPLHYSFAKYITNSETPQLSAHNLWHPLSTSENIQLNSIDLGLNNQSRNIIITGPNACGKSTNLKAITLCAYLAQTLTIVPAQKYSHTIYKEIYSSIVVTDNISENMSLFVAELNNAEELLVRIENLRKDEYLFIVLDELFKSTHHEKGQNVAYELLKHLYQSPRVITIISTHFENLVALADIPENKCTNYTLDNFKLIPGIGSHDDAFEIVKKQSRSRLID